MTYNIQRILDSWKDQLLYSLSPSFSSQYYDKRKKPVKKKNEENRKIIGQFTCDGVFRAERPAKEGKKTSVLQFTIWEEETAEDSWFFGFLTCWPTALMRSFVGLRFLLKVWCHNGPDLFQELVRLGLYKLDTISLWSIN